MGEGDTIMDDSVVVMEESTIPLIDISDASPKKSVTTAAGISNESKELRGMPKSGRFWKQPKQRASSIKQIRKEPLKKKLKDRMEKKQAQEVSKAIREDFIEQKRLKREREAENKKRKEENARKSEIVQKISNTAKLKKMKKKQLRQIEKRDTTNM